MSNEVLHLKRNKLRLLVQQMGHTSQLEGEPLKERVIKIIQGNAGVKPDDAKSKGDVK